MRLVFMGTPDYACPSLRRLHLEHEIVMVYTQPDRPSGRGYQLNAPPVKQLAQSLELPVRQPTTLRSREEQVFLENLQPDAIVVIAYGLLLPSQVLSIAKFGCINAHGSLLPAYRGASPMQQAILNGDQVTGVTTMLMDEGMDTGAILLTETTPLGDKTIGQLHDELAQLSAKLLSQTLVYLERDELEPIPQDNQQASYTSKIHKQDGQVQWGESADQIVRRWRAYQPWPALSTIISGQSVKLTEIKALSEPQNSLPGTVIAVTDSGIDVATGQGSLRIIKLQPAGKRAMHVSEYLRGNPVTKGTKLGE